LDPPVIRASLNRTVVVGVDLRRRLDALAQARGCDSSYLARTILRRFADTAERAARAEAEGE
jgi:hypothetical protein